VPFTATCQLRIAGRPTLCTVGKNCPFFPCRSSCTMQLTVAVVPFPDTHQAAMFVRPVRLRTAHVELASFFSSASCVLKSLVEAPLS